MRFYVGGRARNQKIRLVLKVAFSHGVRKQCWPQTDRRKGSMTSTAWGVPPGSVSGDWVTFQLPGSKFESPWGVQGPSGVAVASTAVWGCTELRKQLWMRMWLSPAWAVLSAPSHGWEVRSGRCWAQNQALCLHPRPSCWAGSKLRPLLFRTLASPCDLASNANPPHLPDTSTYV